jgi:hypothetical protein
MNFPKQFNGPDRLRIRTAFLDAFPAPADLSAFLEDRLDRVLVHYAPEQGNYNDQIFHLLKKSNAQAWISDLLLAALNAVPDNPRLQEIAHD